MSVLIKGMEMPKAGQTIEIAQNVDGNMFARLEPSFDSWHEIIAVPAPHGRLIDADELLKWADVIPLTWDGGVDINDLEEYLDNAPAIIEAEKGEKE